MNLYCVMVPTHRNPEPGRRSDFKWRPRFSRPHDEVILLSVAMLHGGYTFLPPSEGAWMRGFYPQVEGMRPFLFTAGSREQADIIADLVCAHYKQEQVMAGVWAHDVEFRDRRGPAPVARRVQSGERKLELEGPLDASRQAAPRPLILWRHRQ